MSVKLNCSCIHNGVYSYFLLLVEVVVLILVHPVAPLRLTNMTAPVVQDPREPMFLHCRFDMGGEDLYAVKWYKDDHEFFRYTPSLSTEGDWTLFPVAGVVVDRIKSRCSRDSCDLVLVNLTRPESSGAYRCEVSSEAPAFRLAAQTHNVTVAALPRDAPKLEGLPENYLIGDVVVATCTSGPGDPKPHLTWYANKQQVSVKYTKDLPSRAFIAEPPSAGRVTLRAAMSQIRLPIDRKLTAGQPRVALEISCVSSLEGVGPAAAPHLAASRVVYVVDPQRAVNNQKLHWPDLSASAVWRGELGGIVGVTVTVLVAVWWG